MSADAGQIVTNDSGRGSLVKHHTLAARVSPIADIVRLPTGLRSELLHLGTGETKPFSRVRYCRIVERGLRFKKGRKKLAARCGSLMQFAKAQRHIRRGQVGEQGLCKPIIEPGA